MVPCSGFQFHLALEKHSTSSSSISLSKYSLRRQPLAPIRFFPRYGTASGFSKEQMGRWGSRLEDTNSKKKKISISWSDRWSYGKKILPAEQYNDYLDEGAAVLSEMTSAIEDMNDANKRGLV